MLFIQSESSTLLTLVAGVGLGAASTMLIIMVESPLDLLLGFGLGFALAIYLSYHFNAILRNDQVWSLENCTCHNPGKKFCKRHDPKKLKTLAKYIPNENLMIDLCLALHLNANIIEACKNNKRDINVAVYDMLYNKWYKDQECLDSDSKVELKRALREINQSNLIATVVDEYTVQR